MDAPGIFESGDADTVSIQLFVPQMDVPKESTVLCIGRNVLYITRRMVQAMASQYDMVHKFGTGDCYAGWRVWDDEAVERLCRSQVYAWRCWTTWRRQKDANQYLEVKEPPRGLEILVYIDNFHAMNLANNKSFMQLLRHDQGTHITTIVTAGDGGEIPRWLATARDFTVYCEMSARMQEKMERSAVGRRIHTDPEIFEKLKAVVWRANAALVIDDTPSVTENGVKWFDPPLATHGDVIKRPGDTLTVPRDVVAPAVPVKRKAGAIAAPAKPTFVLGVAYPFTGHIWNQPATCFMSTGIAPLAGASIYPDDLFKHFDVVFSFISPRPFSFRFSTYDPPIEALLNKANQYSIEFPAGLPIGAAHLTSFEITHKSAPQLCAVTVHGELLDPVNRAALKTIRAAVPHRGKLINFPGNGLMHYMFTD